jgi:hypothetical protein
MRETTAIILIALLVTAWVYILGRVTMKAWLKEIDYFLGKKFVDYINTKKEKKDGNNKEKK